jgi:hypothetical protein
VYGKVWRDSQCLNPLNEKMREVSSGRYSLVQSQLAIGRLAKGIGRCLSPIIISCLTRSTATDSAQRQVSEVEKRVRMEWRAVTKIRITINILNFSFSSRVLRLSQSIQSMTSLLALFPRLASVIIKPLRTGQGPLWRSYQFERHCIYLYGSSNPDSSIYFTWNCIMLFRGRK